MALTSRTSITYPSILLIQLLGMSMQRAGSLGRSLMPGSRNESALMGRSTKNQKSNLPHRRDYFCPVFVHALKIRVVRPSQVFRREITRIDGFHWIRVVKRCYCFRILLFFLCASLAAFLLAHCPSGAENHPGI